MNNSDKKIKDKKNTIILLLSVIILLLVIGIIIFISLNTMKHKSINGSKMTSTELIGMFNEEGYEIKIYKNGTSTIYVNLENDAEGITFQRIYNTYVGTLMTFDDDSINDEMADLVDTTKNNTVEKKQQYEAYEIWLKKYNITKLQVTEMLDKYYDENKSSAIDLDMLINELMK